MYDGPAKSLKAMSTLALASRQQFPICQRIGAYGERCPVIEVADTQDGRRLSEEQNGVRFDWVLFTLIGSSPRFVSSKQYVEGDTTYNESALTT
jgi:hypothetical protein